MSIVQLYITNIKKNINIPVIILKRNASSFRSQKSRGVRVKKNHDHSKLGDVIKTTKSNIVEDSKGGRDDIIERWTPDKDINKRSSLETYFVGCDSTGEV